MNCDNDLIVCIENSNKKQSKNNQKNSINYMKKYSIL